MISVGSYQVQVRVSRFGVQPALLCPADFVDMPTDWDFAWKEFWEVSDLEFEGFAKLVLGGRLIGLVRYTLFPTSEGELRSIVVEHLEAIPSSRGQAVNRVFEPIGKWLLWYVAQVAFSYCVDNSKNSDDYLIGLEALDSAFSYYRDKVGMEYLGLGAGSPNDDLYTFAFSWEAAKTFCLKQEKEYGLPQRLS